jgi:hypothetical protein
MTLPPNVRVNTQVPFPAQVTGSGPIVVSKASGIWTVFINMAALNIQNPPVGNYPTDYLIVWDSLAQSFFQMALGNLPGASAGARPQRFVNTVPVTISVGDSILNCSFNFAGATIQLPSYLTRSGAPLTIKDIGGFAGAFPITITPANAEFIDGNTMAVINQPHAVITLVPSNDGMSTGWSTE